MNIPVYDFPNSPILLLGFFGILVALITLFITYNKYFNSPLNRDKKFVNNSLEIEFDLNKLIKIYAFLPFATIITGIKR